MQVNESNHHYPNNHDDPHKLRVVRVGDLDVLVLGDGGKAPGYYCFTFSMTNLLRIGKGALGMCLERNFATDRDSVLRLGRRPATTSFERVKEAYLEIKERVTGAIEAEDGAKADQLNLYPLPLVLKLLRLYEPRYLGLETTCTAVEQLLLGRGHDGQDGQQDKEHKASGVPPAEQQQQVGVSW